MTVDGTATTTQNGAIEQGRELGSHERGTLCHSTNTCVVFLVNLVAKNATLSCSVFRQAQKQAGNKSCACSDCLSMRALRYCANANALGTGYGSGEASGFVCDCACRAQYSCGVWSFARGQSTIVLPRSVFIVLLHTANKRHTNKAAPPCAVTHVTSLLSTTTNSIKSQTTVQCTQEKNVTLIIRY